MREHIQPRSAQGGATRQRADGAGSPRDRAALRRGDVAEGLVGIAPRRLPLLAPAQSRARQERAVVVRRP